MRTRFGLVYLGLIVVLVAAVFVYFTAFNPVTRYIHEGLDLRGGVNVVLQADRPATQSDMKKILTIMTFRANEFGVSEPQIQQQGSNQVVVSLPGVKNQEAAIKTIGRTAQLVFKAPNGSVILTGNDLAKAVAAYSSGNTPEVLLTFDAKGTKAFAAATTKYLGQQIAIYLDNQLIQSPQVDAVIPNGQAQISPFSSIGQAQQVAALLNSGALPVPMRIIEVRTVSASLGQASIHASEMAGLMAMILIGVFMIGFYRFAGILANIALVIYMMLVVGVLIGIGAVITLPGVAGLILSAGIAVDANVIIFARIRDELRAGRTIGASIDHGFRNALRAILDSNVSTIIAGAVLYNLGTGEIRGFAVTLMIGVAASMVTAVLVTRYLLRFAEGTRLVRNVTIFLG